MYWQWRGKNSNRRVFMYYDSTLKKNVRLRVGEIPSGINSDDDADAFCRQKESEIEAAKIRIVRRLKWKSRYHNFETLMEVFKNERLKESPNNWKNDIYYMEHYVLNFFINQNTYSNMNDWYIHFEDFKDWLDRVKTIKGNNTLAYSTKNQCIKALNAFLKVMHRKNKVDRVTKCAQFARHLENSKSIDEVISKSDIQRIYSELGTIDETSAALFFLLANTGLRINEGLGLSLDSLVQGEIENKAFHEQLRTHGIDYVGYLSLESQPVNLIRLRDQNGRVPRKALKGRRKIDPKNNRIIPIIDKEVFNTLVKLYFTQRDLFSKKKFGDDPKDYLLFDGLNKQRFGIHLKKACQNLKIRHYTPHSCRHTFATQFTGLTFGNVFLCQMVLGHRDLNTSRKYIHIWEQIQKESKSAQQLKTGIQLIV
ncbi:MAG: site-specific integrase [Bdellovibrionales bacterium]|nr:site-specific integrase [Bdellovibrionales bacterium]